MNDITGKDDFNPSGVGLRNGNFIGLPYSEESARMILIPVPWDVTVSFGEGTALGAEAVREASVQLDLYDPDVQDAWQLGIFMLPENEKLLDKRNALRPLAKKYIGFLEEGGAVAANPEMKKILQEINTGCDEMVDAVYNQSKQILEKGKLAAVVGGDHSVPMGLYKALGEKYTDFGILQIDAHLDLRDSYEGFRWSHASIFNNALKEKSIRKLVQIGIRDYCEEELEVVEREKERVTVFFDHNLKENRFRGMNWNDQCDRILDELPQHVHISLDIDGLDPKLCPHTGTPVPGGLEFAEAAFLFRKLVESGRRIIGFDVCEIGNHPWDSNVGARIIYKLCNLTGRSNGLI